MLRVEDLVASDFLEKNILEARETINKCKHYHGDVFENKVKLCYFYIY